MNAIVLDCSIAVSWFFEDEASVQTDHIMRLIKENSGYVPNLFHLEVCNVLLGAQKKGRIENGQIIGCLEILASLPITTDPETHMHALSDTLSIARAENLTAYDAAYLELALRRNLGLATKDKALLRSAKNLNISIIEG